MDRKSIAVIVACIGFMFLWTGVLVPKYFTKPPPPGYQAKGTNAPSSLAASNATAPTSASPAPAPAANVSFVRPTFATNIAEQSIVLTNENARYTFTSQGGGLKQVELWKFPETISRKTKSGAATNGLVTLN